MLHHIDHINIVVQNLEKNVQFYGEVLGFKETMRATLEGEWIQNIVGLKNVHAECVYMQPEDGPRIELLQYVSPDGTVPENNGLANTIGLRHIAFRVEDIEAEYKRLTEQGVKFIGPPVDVPLKTVTHVAGRKRLCYFHGPEDVLLEICSYEEK